MAIRHCAGVRFLVLGSGVLEWFFLDLPGLVGITRMIFVAGMFLLCFLVSIFSQFNKKHPQIEAKSIQSRRNMMSVLSELSQGKKFEFFCL